MGKTTVRDPAVESGNRIAETEIDLKTIDRYSKNFLVGECKFKGKPFTYTEYLNTIAKLEPLKFERSDPVSPGLYDYADLRCVFASVYKYINDIN